MEESKQAASNSQPLAKSHAPNRSRRRIPNRSRCTSTGKHSKSSAHTNNLLENSHGNRNSTTPTNTSDNPSRRRTSPSPEHHQPNARRVAGGGPGRAQPAARRTYPGPVRARRGARMRIPRRASRGDAGGGIWGGGICREWRRGLARFLASGGRRPGAREEEGEAGGRGSGGRELWPFFAR
jgi:hypothetical protein